MGKFRKSKPQDRDGVCFANLPHVVLQSKNYIGLSANAKALLLEVVLQVKQPSTENNGKLLISRAYLSDRGWSSMDMLTKGKRELLDGGFIFETVKGHRPNKASWYAVTWHPLAKLSGYDAGSEQLFRRGAYKDGDFPTPKPSRQDLYDKWKSPVKNASLTPSHGTEDVRTAPLHGTEGLALVPSHGAVMPSFGGSPVPQDGHHLDMPSAGDRDPVRIQASHTTMGRMLRCVRPKNRPLSYYAARANLHQPDSLKASP